MLIEILVLGSIFYTSFNIFKKEGEKNTSTTTIKTKGVMDEKLTQMFQEVGETHQDGKYSALTIKEQNRRDIASTSIAMVFSVAGFWLYQPLSLLSIPFTLYASKQIYKRTYEHIKQGKTSIEILITMSILGCFMVGQFFLAALMVLIVRLADRLTMLVTQDSKQQLVGAFEQQPDFVWIIVEGVEVRIPFKQLKKNDIVVVQTGEMVPADGIVIVGMANIDQHILTGEARPVEKILGDEVFASTVVLSGKIQIRIERTGEESTVAKITHILNTTIDFKSTTQLRAETLSRQLVNPVLIASCMSFPILGFRGALAIVTTHPKNRMTAIAPITILNYFKLASEQGILIKDGRSLELLNKVDTIVFDKTGTLTEEQPHIGAIHRYSDYTDNDILFYAATAEYKQKHPLAKAILQEAKQRQLNIPVIEDSEYKLGYGLIVKVAGQSIHVGSERFMKVENIPIPPALNIQQELSQQEGYSLVIVAVDHQIVGAIELLPTVRPEAIAVIRQLKQRPNIKATYIISGDNEIPTQKLAQTLGIDHYVAETLPEDKANIIEQLQAEGHFICYIGDGINDSIAMKKSQVSISLAGASSIATDTAQIVLMDNGISHLNLLFDIAKNFNTNMNTTFAFMMVPAILGISGAFLLNFGVAQTIILNMICSILSLTNAMIPWLKQTDKLLKLETPPKSSTSERE
jgi:heavy metal translocating P-type ATPase